MLNFTKGKWFYEEHHGAIDIFSAYDKYNNIATLYDLSTEGWDNARLIASAPELYDIVKSLTECKPHSFSELKMRAHEFIKQLEQESNNA